MKRLLIALGFGFVAAMVAAAPVVPSEMRFCDIELGINADARTKIQETITKLKPGSTYFKALVDRANIYFPFVEEAFALRGVPEDLKYIVIQESSLNADAISPSNAVGYWQFKEESGRESGLQIDASIDERRHIFQSSLAAAKYFYTIARYFDNYLYAAIGYNRGPVGALGYVNVADFGSRKMTLTGETHWYALKCIAFKLAFEEAVGKSAPPLWLQPHSTKGETDPAKLAASHSMTLEEFKSYNSWIRGSQIPEGKTYVYYVPRRDAPQRDLMRHVGVTAKVTSKPKPQPPISTPPPQIGNSTRPGPTERPTPARDTRRFSYLEQDADPAYGEEYVRMKEGESLVEVAVRNGVKIKKLQSYNGIGIADRPVAGTLIYLKAPKSRQYHVVRPGETLGQIATSYGTTVEKLRAKNRIGGNTIYAGQRLNLKKTVGKGAKPLLLVGSQALPVEEETEETPEPEVVILPKETTPKEEPEHAGPITQQVSRPGILEADAASFRLPAFESKVVTHTVAANESIWKVAKKYGAYAEVIKKMNGMSSSELRTGSQIKVLQVQDRN